MMNSKLSKILAEWSDEFHKDYMESFDLDLRSGNYRDLLSEFIDRVDALHAYVNKPWYKR